MQVNVLKMKVNVGLYIEQFKKTETMRIRGLCSIFSTKIRQHYKEAGFSRNSQSCSSTGPTQGNDGHDQQSLHQSRNNGEEIRGSHELKNIKKETNKIQSSFELAHTL